MTHCDARAAIAGAAAAPHWRWRCSAGDALPRPHGAGQRRRRRQRSAGVRPHHRRAGYSSVTAAARRCGRRHHAARRRHRRHAGELGEHRLPRRRATRRRDHARPRARLYGALINAFVASMVAGGAGQQPRRRVGRHRGDDGVHRAARRTPAHPGIAGGDLEVRRRLLGRHHPGLPRHGAALLREPARRAGRARARLRRAGRASAPARPGRHAAGRRTAAARLRHQSRAGAVSHLARRRAQPGPRPRLRADERRAAVGRVLRAAAHQADRRRRARHHVHAGRAAHAGAADAADRRIAAGRASATTSACSPTPRSSTWASSPSPPQPARTLALAALLLHVLAHGLGKSVLFLGAGHLQHAHHSTAIADIRGVLAPQPAARRRARRRADRAARAATLRAVRQRDRHGPRDWAPRTSGGPLPSPSCSS